MRHLGVPYANFVTGSGDGLDVEIMQGFARYLGVRYEFVPTTWDDAIGDLTGNDAGRPIAVIKQGIENSPLALVTLITAEELSAYSIPSLFLVAVGAVPFIVLYIILLELYQRRRCKYQGQL